MPALVEAHPKNAVARLEQSGEGGQIGTRAAVRLHVGVIGPEQLVHAVDREALDVVAVFTPRVVAASGVAFSILVREHRPGGGEHVGGGVVLGGDEHHLLAQAPFLGCDGPGYIGILLGNW